jgi:hypothetical protein
MFGAGILLRVVGRAGGKLLDRLGVLPARWYLREALEALSKDDLPRVIRSLERARGGNPRHWELIRQQAIFRCRVLNETHMKALQRFENLQKAGGFATTTESELEQAMELHRLAVRILSGYEATLQNLH